ncbi:MAG: hypothetical protein AAF568_07055 [Pseudomonadota bacterium]
MTNPNRPQPQSVWRDLWRSWVQGLASALGWLVGAFVFGTVAAGIACLWYGEPLHLAFFGGVAMAVVVLVAIVAFSTSSPWY